MGNSTVCSMTSSGQQQQQQKHHRSAFLAPCEWNPPVTGGFPSQRASTLPSVSILSCGAVWSLLVWGIDFSNKMWLSRGRVPERSCWPNGSQTANIRQMPTTHIIEDTPNIHIHIDGLVQGRRNSSALAMELRLSCTNQSTCNRVGWLICPEGHVSSLNKSNQTNM